jgi:phosphoglycerate dehydrogenase-like enzyme
MSPAKARALAAAVCAVALVTLSQPLVAQAAAGTCPACAEAQAVVAELGLREAPAPVRERADWAPPRRIVTTGGEQMGALLRQLAPAAEVVVIANEDAAIAALRGADVFVGWCSPEIVGAAATVRWIQLTSAGAEECAELETLRTRGTLVTNAQRVRGPEIAEHVMAMMLSYARRLDLYGTVQRMGRWDRALQGLDAEARRPTWTVEDKTLLVVGLGGIGTEVARRAHGLGMRVIATRNSGREGPDFVEYVGLADELPTLAGRADVVVSAVPLTDDTKGMFDAAFFAAMKPTALFINVGRGGTVVTDALTRALATGVIAGAGLDVTEPEPLPDGHPLWAMPNVIITPHVAAASDDLGRRLRLVVAENVRRYVAGERMLSVVDLDRGY